MANSSKPAAERASEFARLYSQNARRIYSYILTLLPHWADADEVFQETTTLLWEKLDEFEPGTNFRAWACRIAYYRTIWYRQRQKNVPVPFGDKFLEVVDAEIVSQHDILEDRHLALADCLQKLAPRDRELVQQCYSPGLSIKEAARRVGRTADSAYKALRRIHQSLYDCVERARKREGSP